MTQRVQDNSNQSVQIINATPIVIQGDPAGVPVPVSGAGGYTPPLLADCGIDKTIALPSGTSFNTYFHVQNLCRESRFQPLVGILTKHAVGTNLQMKWLLYATLADLIAADPWGSSTMQTIAGSGWNATYMGYPTPSGLPLQAGSSRLEAIGWQYAAVQLAWTGAGSGDVRLIVASNFPLAEYVP